MLGEFSNNPVSCYKYAQNERFLYIVSIQKLIDLLCCFASTLQVIFYQRQCSKGEICMLLLLKSMLVGSQSDV